MAYTIPQSAKSIGAFLATAGAVAAGLLANAAFTSIVPPWVTVILTSLVAAGIVAGVVFALPNEQSIPQIVNSAKDAGLAVGAAITPIVISKASDAAADAIEKAVNQINPQGGEQVRGVVEAISNQARAGVEELLGKYKVG